MFVHEMSGVLQTSCKMSSQDIELSPVGHSMVITITPFKSKGIMVEK